MMNKLFQNKRILYSGVVLIFLALGVWLIIHSYSSFRKNNVVEQSDLLLPVPEQAALMIKVSSIKSLYTDIEALSKQKEQSGKIFYNLKHQFDGLDSIISYFPLLKNNIEDLPILISWHLQGQSELKLFAVIHFGMLKEKDQVEGMVKTKLGIQFMRMYNGASIYSIPSKIGYIAFWKHYCLMSSSSIIIEQSILKLNSGESLNNSPDFAKVLHSTGSDANANLFIHFPTFQKAIQSKIDNQSLLDQIRRWGTWGGYDIDLSNKGIAMRGFCAYGEKNLLQLLKGQNAQSSNLMKLFPNNVDCFLSIPINNYKKYADAYKNWLDLYGGASDYSKKIKSFKKYFGMTVPSFVQTYFGGEVGLLLLGRSQGNIGDDKVLVMNLTSGNAVQLLLDQCLKNSAVAKQYDIIIDSDSKYTAYQIPNFDLWGTLWGSLFSSQGNCLYVIYNNLLLCSTNKDKLREFIYQNTLKRTFVLGQVYDTHKDNLNQPSNLYWYMQGGKSKQFFKDLFLTDYGLSFATNNDLTNTFGGASAVIDLNNEMAYTSVFAAYLQKGMQEAQTVWQSKIDDQMDFKPHFVINHLTGEREILIQDVNNVLYLINNSGRILWKKPLKGRIVGDVTQVDYYKNGKLQMWFATTDALHLIDRNGNYVERYPVLFPSKATNGLAVFDYDNNRTYRGFIACEDHRVYAYSLDGNKVSGWSFGKTEREVSTPVQWFRNKEKDYLLFADDYRTYILNRKGEELIKPQGLTPKASQSLFYMEENEANTCFLTTTPQGKILRIFLDGKIKSSEIAQFTPNHFFSYSDINGDGRNDFIYADGNKLFVYTSKGKLLYKATTPSDISYTPSIYSFSPQDVEIGVVCKKDNQIMLYNQQGKLRKGFPLQGQTMFSVGLLNNESRKFSLVVGGKNNYLYNYSIE